MFHVISCVPIDEAAMIARSDSEHLDYLDGWRGLAITLLLMGHFFPIPGLNLGALGVNFFFVLSGWLMTRLLFVQDTPIDAFYRRRISRIIPAHLMFLGLLVAWRLSAGLPFNVEETLAAALFVNNYVGSPPGQSVMPFGHIWSLSVEEHSYVLLSLLAVAARRRIITPTVGVGLVAFGCAVFAAWYGWHYAGPKLAFSLWLHTEVAGYGIFLSGYLLLSLRRQAPRHWPKHIVPLLVAVGIASHWWSIPIVLQQLLGVGALALAINLLLQAPPPLKKILSSKPLRYLGLWSFSLYIWQQPFYLWSRGGAAPTLVGLLLAATFGLISYYFIEKPARRYLNNTWGQRKSILIAKI
jgi:peptidoglycan/LPS O-acetylase OafA/YrhL